MENQVIVTEKGMYHLYNYQSESELERMILDHSTDIFGKNTRYFDFKKKIKSKSGFGTIPDGYLIDFENKRLFIVEVELICHDLKKHILPQIANFVMALENENSRNHLLRVFSEELSLDAAGEQDLKKMLLNYSIVILIDEVGDPMKEVNPLLEIVNFLIKHAEVIVIPFQTFVKEGKYTSDHIHFFKSFTREELEQESKKWSFKWTTVPIEKHLENTSQDIREVFNKLSTEICLLPNVKQVNRKDWTTFQTSPLKNFCTVKFLSDTLEIHIKANKNTFIDEKEITTDVKRTPAWTFDKRFLLKSANEVPYAKGLINQAYEFLCCTNKES